MVNFNRSEDKKALLGTLTVYLLLFLMLILMSMFNACSEVEAEEFNAGGVAISLGNPEDGGPDNTSAEEETVEQTEDEYTPENQLTSDVIDAPPVIKNEPKTQSNPNSTIKASENKPIETKPLSKPPKINIGKNKFNEETGDIKTKSGKFNLSDCYLRTCMKNIYLHIDIEKPPSTLIIGNVDNPFYKIENNNIHC